MATTPINNTEAMRTWLRNCPEIVRRRAFGVDYLEDTGSYSLDSVPSALSYRENILGEMVLRETQTQNFVFASRQPYGPDYETNQDNAAFFQAVSAWIIAQNNSQSFPDWEGGTVLSIVPTVTAYPMQMGTDFARYQIQIRVTYRVTATN